VFRDENGNAFGLEVRQKSLNSLKDQWKFQKNMRGERT
jgi:hypothetical protein